jgi:hypothetical protein
MMMATTEALVRENKKLVMVSTSIGDELPAGGGGAGAV